MLGVTRWPRFVYTMRFEKKTYHLDCRIGVLDRNGYSFNAGDLDEGCEW
jgi:hypothetical protein